MTERKIYIMRHGERCDFLMGNRGASFMKSAFDANGKYTPFDINLPRVLPKRSDGWQAFAHDTPLTEIGYLEAKLTGRAYRDKGVVIDHFYCSPALRCVQTAIGFLKGMGSPASFRIEPGLFEWMHWCHNGRPSWMQSTEFKKLGYAISSDYNSFMKDGDLRMTETLDDYYRRSYSVIQHLTKLHPTGNIMIVAHGASPDVLSRQLLGLQPRTQDEFFHILLQTSYLGNIELTELNGQWSLSGRPVNPLTVSAINSYNPNILMMRDEDVQEELRRKKEAERRRMDVPR